MTDQQINNLARIAAESTASLYPTKTEKEAIDLFLKAYKYAKEMIVLKQIYAIEVPEDINKISQATAQASVSWDKNLLSIESDVDSFLYTYESMVRHFVHFNTEFQTDSEEVMDMVISSLRTVLYSHKRYYDKALVDVVLDAYNYAVENIKNENQKNR